MEENSQKSSADDADFESFLAALAASPAPYRPPALGPGQVFAGRYCVDRELGRGGMGTVYLAIDRQLGRKVALKIARGRRAEVELARLQHEATVMASLSHPGIVTVFEAGAAGDDVYLALEFVPGGTLQDWLDVETRSWREIVKMFATIAEGLFAAHQAGVIHRDFKPLNVLLDLRGRPRIADFGLARTHVEPETLDVPLFSSSGTLTVSGSVVGTPAYMAPEQAKGRGASEASDQFSFFVSLYEALAGRRPFQARTLPATLDAIEKGPPTTYPNAPRALAQVIRRGLLADPTRRHRDMATVAEALDRVLQTRRRRTRNVVFSLAAVAAMGFGFVSAPEPPSPCEAEDLAASLDAIWTESARARVEVSTDDATVAAMDAYRDELVQHRVDACRANAVTGSLSDTDLALRMACLDRLEGRFSGLSNDLAGNGSLDASIDTLLSDPVTCEDVHALRLLENAYESDSARSNALQDRAYRKAEELRMRAALQSRRGEDASEVATQLLDLAKEYGLRDMEAYALLFLSAQEMDLQRVGTLLEEAQSLANQDRNARLLTEVALQRSVHALRSGEPRRADAFIENAEALHWIQTDASAQAHERLRIDLTRQQIRLAEGDLDGAVEGLSSVLERLDPELGEAFEARLLLANALDGSGQLARAIAEYTTALTHPVAEDPGQRFGILLNRGYTEVRADRPDDANQSFDAASRVLGEPEALPEEQRALIAMGRAGALRLLGSLSEAKERADAAKSTFEAASPSHPVLGHIFDELAAIAEPTDPVRALEYLDEALRRHDAVEGPSSSTGALTNVRRARVLHHLNRSPEALAAAKAALDVLQNTDCAPDELAVAELALALVTGVEDPEARIVCEDSEYAICREALADAAGTALSP